MCSKCKSTGYIKVTERIGGKFSQRVKIKCPVCHGTRIGK